MNNAEKEKALSELSERLEEIEQEQSNGAKYFTIEELDAALREQLAAKHNATKRTR